MKDIRYRLAETVRRVRSPRYADRFVGDRDPCTRRPLLDVLYPGMAPVPCPELPVSGELSALGQAELLKQFCRQEIGGRYEIWSLGGECVEWCHALGR